MISERLAQLESTLKEHGDSMPEATRRELVDLVAGLRAEVTSLLKTHGENAQRIAGSAEAAVHASVQRDEHPEKAAEAVRGLTASVREFEATHPRLVEIVDQLALTLSNLGI
jgi:cell division septum initiation protein DivIVA